MAEPTASDVVRQAAEEDSKASIETWGPEAFARRLRTKLHNIKAPIPPWLDQQARPTPSAPGIPKRINIILLGPTGSGKSSLIYTWWRAMSGSVSRKQEFLSARFHKSLLHRLRVGWGMEDAEKVCPAQVAETEVAVAAAVAKGEGEMRALTEESMDLEDEDGNKG
ncbi:unnamed protein product, partial [Discosporangium mesarthrocarpum]